MGWSIIISNTALGDPLKNSKCSQTILPAEVIYVFKHMTLSAHFTFKPQEETTV